MLLPNATYPAAISNASRPQQQQLTSCGHKRVIVDAVWDAATKASEAIKASDGSSTMCPECGELVERERWHAHVQHWCPSLHTHQDEDMEMEEDRAAIPLYLFQPSL